MTVDEFLRRISEQPEVKETRKVRVWGPTLRAEVESGRLRILADIEAHPDQTWELRTFRYGHLAGPGLRPDEIKRWQKQYPKHPLPADFTQLLTKANGIHLCADLDVGRAYWGLLPLADWEDAASVGWVSVFREPPVGRLAISYHSNGDYFLSLDTSDSTYHWHDVEDYGSDRLVGTSVNEFLDWYWTEAQTLDPRA